MIRFLISLLVLLIGSNNLSAQMEKDVSTAVEHDYKNAILITLGTPTLSLFYERKLITSTKHPKVTFLSKVGLIGISGEGEEQISSSIVGGVLVGKRASYFEALLGVGLVYNYGASGLTPNDIEKKFYYTGFIPNISVGYRLQKPNRRMMFRTGLSFPQGIYVGTGISF